jgi:hypothetical protein
MTKIFLVFWSIAALVTLDRTLRHPPVAPDRPVPAIMADTLPVIRALQTRCELPAGTTVFVVRDPAR